MEQSKEFQIPILLPVEQGFPQFLYLDYQCYNQQHQNPYKHHCLTFLDYQVLSLLTNSEATIHLVSMPACRISKPEKRLSLLFPFVYQTASVFEKQEYLY